VILFIPILLLSLYAHAEIADRFSVDDLFVGLADIEFCC